MEQQQKAYSLFSDESCYLQFNNNDRNEIKERKT